jgi:hypothetical protein
LQRKKERTKPGRFVQERNQTGEGLFSKWQRTVQFVSKQKVVRRRKNESKTWSAPLFSFSDRIFVLQFLHRAKFLSNFIFNQLSYFSTCSIWSLVKKKKSFKLACNWFSNFKHLAIVSLQTWAKIFLAAEIPAFTLDIQTRMSWASDIKIKQFKSPNSSTCPGLHLWWRIRSEINSFWITELQPNSAGNLLAAGFYVFTLDFKQEYLELLILKSSNSKSQIHLRVLDYNFDEGFKVR